MLAMTNPLKPLVKPVTVARLTGISATARSTARHHPQCLPCYSEFGPVQTKFCAPFIGELDKKLDSLQGYIFAADSMGRAIVSSAQLALKEDQISTSRV